MDKRHKVAAELANEIVGFAESISDEMLMMLIYTFIEELLERKFNS